jgi:hypothetical protein
MAVTIEVSGADVLAGRLRAIGDDAPKAVLRALTRTRTTIMTRIARIVAQASGLGVRRVRRSLHGSKPTFGDPTSLITIWGGRDKLIEYSRTIEKRELARAPGAFLARMPRGGHIGWFERRPGQLSVRSMPGRAKAKRIRPGIWHSLPIDEAWGPPFTEFVSGTALDAILREGGEVFRKNLEHEIAFRESRRAAAAA